MNSVFFIQTGESDTRLGGKEQPTKHVHWHSFGACRRALEIPIIKIKCFI